MPKAHETAGELIRTEAFRLPVLKQAISLLNLPPGSRGLDVGCGAGTISLLLAKALGPKGQVVALDQDQDLLDLAEQRAAEQGLGDRISFKQGDMNSLPWEGGEFDWLVSVDCAGYAPTAEPRPLVRELARVLKPGKTLALMAWSSQMILPGYPVLEARLNATPAGIAPYFQDRPPEDHFFRALGWFKEAGLVESGTVTLAGQCGAPLNEDERAGMAALLAMRWPGSEKELPEDQTRLFKELTDPDSKDYILNRPDYQAFFTYTMFRGRKKG